MFKLKKAEVLPLTRELAETFTSMPASTGERPLDGKRCEFLTNRILDGLSTVFNWVQVEMPDGTVKRGNGQHSSHSLSALNGEFPAGLQVCLSTYTVETPDDLCVLFEQFDPVGSSRKPRDIAYVWQKSTPETINFDAVNAKKIIEGICWHERQIVGMPVKGDARYQYFKRPTTWKYMGFMDTKLNQKTPELKSDPVLAALYAIFQVAEADAITFIEQLVRGGKEYDEGHPTSVLSAWLQGIKEMKVKPRPAERYNGVIAAWNAVRDGRTLSRISVKKLADMLEPKC